MNMLLIAAALITTTESETWKTTELEPANDYSCAWYSCSEVDGDFELPHRRHGVRG